MAYVKEADTRPTTAEIWCVKMFLPRHDSFTDTDYTHNTTQHNTTQHNTTRHLQALVLFLIAHSSLLLFRFLLEYFQTPAEQWLDNTSHKYDENVAALTCENRHDKQRERERECVCVCVCVCKQ